MQGHTRRLTRLSLRRVLFVVVPILTLDLNLHVITVTIIDSISKTIDYLGKTYLLTFFTNQG